jgi:hypothetical protein
VPNSEKMADFCGFYAVRMLRSSAFGCDDLACEWHALSAFGLAAERAIGLAGADCALTGRGSDIAFPNCIADADDHRILALDESLMAIMRVIRKG